MSSSYMWHVLSLVIHLWDPSISPWLDHLCPPTLSPMLLQSYFLPSGFCCSALELSSGVRIHVGGERVGILNWNVRLKFRWEAEPITENSDTATVGVLVEAMSHKYLLPEMSEKIETVLWGDIYIYEYILKLYGEILKKFC